MSGAASLAVFALLGLWAANAWTTNRGTFSQLAAGNFQVSGWKTLGFELLGILVASFIAGTSDNSAKLILVFALALWVLFAINTWGGSKSKKAAPTTTTAKGATA